MNFIEAYFGFSPDNADGSLEIWILLALTIVIGAIGMASQPPAK